MPQLFRFRAGFLPPFFPTYSVRPRYSSEAPTWFQQSVMFRKCVIVTEFCLKRLLSGGDASTIKVNVDFSVLQATRGAGNLNHQVTITHAWHVCSQLRLDFH